MARDFGTIVMEMAVTVPAIGFYLGIKLIPECVLLTSRGFLIFERADC